MNGFYSPDFGFITKVSPDGVFTKHDEDGEERRVFTLEKKDPDAPQVPNCHAIRITQDAVEIFWGKPESIPSARFERV